MLPDAVTDLQSVLRHPAIWRGGALVRADGQGLPSGYPALDAALPGGGWPQGGMTELVLAQPGSGELSLLQPALRQLSARRHVLLIAPPQIPYAPAWLAAGVVLTRLVWVRPRSRDEALWAMEQGLRDPACGGVLGWLAGAIDDRACRRLQLAAQTGSACGFLLRQARSAAQVSSPLALRLAVSPAPDGIDVRILKRRGPPLPHAIRLTPLQADHALARTVPARSAAGRLPARRHAA
ncbi:cell division inhibitor SulA [Andreprevotia lacus DSM 23236]|jgi:hypothetical protein|uniref:Cell division inhibitor SulA n=1 Tax=Andreprevotia lacus DSM 23236 TaxID=1121001 RepID=A0A1W1XGZ9_9NEIS|nr:translesion DNA synthesis-associated protein ImuA [Andreprevotia lacus]SMC22798.1 cell division inhibitor SulA [Andreprevotia lacus DSM 23236]